MGKYFTHTHTYLLLLPSIQLMHNNASYRFICVTCTFLLLTHFLCDSSEEQPHKHGLMAVWVLELSQSVSSVHEVAVWYHSLWVGGEVNLPARATHDLV